MLSFDPLTGDFFSPDTEQWETISKAMEIITILAIMAGKVKTEACKTVFYTNQRGSTLS